MANRNNRTNVAVIAIALIPAELAFAFSLWFSPGWANRWPGGLSFHFIWPAGLAALLFVLLMTTATAIGALIAFASNRQSGLRAFWMWLAVAAIPALGAAAWAFAVLRAEVLAMFPNGYNP